MKDGTRLRRAPLRVLLVLRVILRNLLVRLLVWLAFQACLPTKQTFQIAKIVSKDDTHLKTTHHHVLLVLRVILRNQLARLLVCPAFQAGLATKQVFCHATSVTLGITHLVRTSPGMAALIKTNVIGFHKYGSAITCQTTRSLFRIPSNPIPDFDTYSPVLF